MALTIPEDIKRNATPKCSHFGECGGCSLQDVTYEEQLLFKRNILTEMLGREIEVVGSPAQYGFRHRMDFATAFGKVGLRKKGDAKSLVNLGECHVVKDRISKLIPKIQAWIEEFGVRGFNFITKKGDIRFVTFRHAISSDQLMIIVVTKSKETKVAPLIEKLKGEAETVIWSVQERIGDDSHGAVQEAYGMKLLNQKIGNFEFVISPGCFFQNNLVLADQLFEEISGFVSGYTMDLFCGTGTIGIYTSGNATEVVGVEIMEENIRLAELNASNNNVSNIKFVLDNANHYLAHYEGPRPDTVILDPPRSGLAPKFIRKINRLRAENLVYVSCNPKTYVNDLQLLEAYKLESIKAFDMFPQTPHVEIVSQLKLK